MNEVVIPDLPNCIASVLAGFWLAWRNYHRKG